MEPEGSLPHSQLPAHLSLSLASSIQSIPPHPTSWRLLFRSYRSISLGPRLCLWTFRNKIRFHGEELLALRPTHNVEYHPLSAVRDCLFNISAAKLYIGGRSSVRNLRTRHAVVTGTNIRHESKLHIAIFPSGVPSNFFRGGGSTNSVEDRGQTERGSGDVAL